MRLKKEEKNQVAILLGAPLCGGCFYIYRELGYVKRDGLVHGKGLGAQSQVSQVVAGLGEIGSSGELEHTVNEWRDVSIELFYGRVGVPGHDVLLRRCVNTSIKIARDRRLSVIYTRVSRRGE